MAVHTNPIAIMPVHIDPNGIEFIEDGDDDMPPLVDDDDAPDYIPDVMPIEPIEPSDDMPALIGHEAYIDAWTQTLAPPQADRLAYLQAITVLYSQAFIGL